jgi:hypothetical protein
MSMYNLYNFSFEYKNFFFFSFFLKKKADQVFLKVDDFIFYFFGQKMVEKDGGQN